MATRTANPNAKPDMRDYTSQRVFDGVRPLTNDAKRTHLARLKKALAKREGK